MMVEEVVVLVVVEVEESEIAMHGVPLVSGTKRRAGVTRLAWQRWN